MAASRKNISLEAKHLKQLEPLVEQHDGNFSETIREIIEFVDLLVQRYGSLNAARYANMDDRYQSPRELLIEDGFCAMIDYPLFEWFLKSTEGIVIDSEILDDIIDPLIINRISELVDHLNRKWKEYGWQTTIIIEYDSDVAPKTAISVITGRSMQLNESLSGMIGLFLARQKHLGVARVDRRTRSIRMDLQRKDNIDAACDDLIRHFGDLHVAISEIRKKPDFWQTIIDLHRNSGYNMVTIHRHEFEDLLAHNTPIDTTVLKGVMKNAAEQIDFLKYLKHVYETMHIVEHIDINGDKIMIEHGFRDSESITAVKEILVKSLAASGYEYIADEVGRLIVMQPVDSE